MSPMFLLLICALILMGSCLAKDIPYIFDENSNLTAFFASFQAERDGASLTNLAEVPNIPSYDRRGINSGDIFGLLMDSNRKDIKDLGPSIVAGDPGNGICSISCGFLHEALNENAINGHYRRFDWADSPQLIEHVRGMLQLIKSVRSMNI